MRCVRFGFVAATILASLGVSAVGNTPLDVNELKDQNSEIVAIPSLTEDDGYWERFLQEENSLPTAPPTVPPCDVEVVLTCIIVDSGDDCSNLPVADGPDECEVDLLYTYTVNNVGPTAEKINSLTRTVTGTINEDEIEVGTLDLIGRLDDTDLDVGEEVIVTETATVDVCNRLILTYSTEVNADSLSGKPCNDDDTVTVSTEVECDVDVELTCETEDGADCSTVQAPNTVCVASPTAVRFEYTGSNCDGDPNCIDSNDGPAANAAPVRVIISDEDSGDIITDRSDVTSGAPIPVEAGSSRTLPQRLSVEVSADDGTTLQENVVDVSCSDEQPLRLQDEFGALKLTSFTNTIQGENDCELNIVYTYVVDNVGPTTERINILTTTVLGVTTDLTDDLDDLVLEPGDSVQVTNDVTVDVCEEDVFETSGEVEASPIDDVSKVCNDQDEVSFEPAKACDVDVTLTCRSTEGGFPCDEIPETETVEDCDIDITYTFTVSNLGPTTETINELSVTYGGITEDVTSELSTTVLEPTDVVSIEKQLAINICPGVEEEVAASATVDASPPPPGKTCTDSEELVFSIPPVECDLEVELTCSTIVTVEDGTESEVSCDEIPTPETVEDCSRDITYTYTIVNEGLTTETIRALNVTQGDVTEDCTDDLDTTEIVPGANISVEKTITIDMCPLEPDEITAGAVVDATPRNGEPCRDEEELTFPIEAPLCDIEVELTCETTITGDDGTESVISCDEIPVPEDSDDCTQDITYTYTIVNEGLTTENISRLSVTQLGETEDCTDDLETTEVAPGSTLSVEKSVSIDLCPEQPEDITASAVVDATPRNGEPCSDEEELSFPIPSPPCDIEVDLACFTVIGGFSLPCEEIPLPETLEDCSRDITYRYTITNEGLTDGTVNSLTVTQGGETEDCTDDLETTDVVPGDNLIVQKTITVSMCPQEPQEIVASAVVDATPEGAEECLDSDELTIDVSSPLCNIGVELTCTTTITDEDGDDSEVSCEDIPEPTSPGDCSRDVTYTYTITNNGLTDEDISALTVTQAGETEDCTDDLETTEVVAGTSIAVEKTITIDMCPQEAQEISASATVDATPRNGERCGEADDLVFSVAPPECDISVAISCTDPDGDDCGNIEQPTNPRPGNCNVELTYSFVVKNDGLTAETIRRARATRDNDSTNLLSGLEDPVVEAGAETVLVETVETNICVTETIRTEVVIEAVSRDGEECEADDRLRFSLAFETAEPTNEPTNEPTIEPTKEPTDEPVNEATNPPTPNPSNTPTVPPSPGPTGEACEVNVDISCQPVDGLVSACEAIPPRFTQCLQRPTIMTMRYNGGSCLQSFNLQGIDKFDCNDLNGGPPSILHTAQIRIVALKDESIVYFDGDVDVNSEFEIFDQANPGGRVEADMLVTIEVDGTERQVTNFHSSCSQNLFLKDKYGAVQLVGFLNEVQGTVSCFVNATYGFVIRNTGSFTNAELESFIVIRNGERFDFTDRVAGSFLETGGGDVTIVQPILLDITVRRTYTTTIILTAVNPANGRQCEDRETLIFEAGNPVPVGFPAVPTPTTSPTPDFDTPDDPVPTPSRAPVSPETAEPTEVPDVDTDEPTDSPAETDDPTDSPADTDEPTDSPADTDEPTDAPDEPTEAPIVAPTSPTAAPIALTDSPVAQTDPPVAQTDPPVTASPTTGSDACSISADITCVTADDATVPCEEAGVCRDRPSSVTFRYVPGRPCGDSTNDQGGDFGCGDVTEGSFDSVLMLITSGLSANIAYFNGQVGANEEFVARAESGEIAESMSISIVDPGTFNVVQGQVLVTTCAEGMSFSVGDAFGSLDVTAFENGAQGTVTGTVPVSYDFVVSNTGGSDATLTAASVSIQGGASQDILASLSTTNLSAGESASASETSSLNLLEGSRTYTTTLQVSGDPGGCSTGASSEFTVP